MRREIIFAIVIFAGMCAGATITVNKDGTGNYLKIQEGIDAAVDGDTVIVSTGTYLEKIYFGGKNIVLRSTDPLDRDVVETTIINYLGVGGSIITFNGSETEDCILTGFTITGGYSLYGGGIRGSYTHATISNCVITGNRADNGGGLHGCYGTISNCTITDNTADNGGGLFICRGTIINCVISLNFAYLFGGGLDLCDGKITNCTITGNQVNIAGGGLFGCNGTIQNCTITNNNSTRYGGGLNGCDANIINCIIWGNSAIESGDQIYQIYAIPTYSCIQDWPLSSFGNISFNPLFDIDGIHLTSYSPCIDAGDPDYVAVPGEIDIDGQPRIIARIDMGVDEFYNSEILMINLTDHRLRFSALVNSSNPEDQSVTIRHYCVPDLNWTITEDCSWLDVTPISGVTAYGQEDEITFSVDITGLTEGYYSCEVIVSDPAALNSPVAVTVSLTIRGPKISGYVTDTDSGLGISSVLVSADNGGDSDTTDTDGYYEVIVPYGWNGTVTPSKADWLFTPLDRTYSNVTTDLSDENYSGSQLTISGYVTDGVSGMPDVLVSAVGVGSAATDETGYYEVNVPYGWSGTVQPEKTGWRFDPPSLSYIDINTDQTDGNFVGRQAVISGFVTDEEGIGLEGILVSGNNSASSDITDINGYYELIFPFDYSGTVTVSSDIWAFVPSMRYYYNVETDFTNQDYTAYVRTKPVGYGTEADPYLIRTLSDFDEFASDPNYWAEGIYTRLECDPNLTGRTYTAAVIAPYTSIDWPYYGTPFKGVFDGNGNVISNFTCSTTVRSLFVGLFGYVEGPNSRIKNLGLENFSIISSDALYFSGGLCGANGDWMNPGGTISNCYAIGTITGNDLFDSVGGLCGFNGSGMIINSHAIIDLTSGTESSRSIGGLCGESSFGATIQDSYALGSVNIVYNYMSSYIGGLCGRNGYYPFTDLTGDSIINCHANVTVTGGDYSEQVGGLVGLNTHPDNTIINCSSAGMVTGQSVIGGLCGVTYGTISNCSSTGEVTGTRGGLGGLCGGNAGTISDCYATGNVTGGDGSLGGLCGSNGGTIDTSFATGSVTGEYFLGGLCGTNWDGIISNCYAAGSVIGQKDSWGLGGLCGSNWDTINNCYAVGFITAGEDSENLGGLCGSQDGDTSEIANCFWDIDTSDMIDGVGNLDPDPVGAIGLTTEQMQDPNTFLNTGWDFVGEDVNGTNDIWRMCVDGIDYPHLSHEYSINGDLACPDGIDLIDFSFLSGDWQIEGLEPYEPPDLTGDGIINIDDIVIFTEHWLED